MSIDRYRRKQLAKRDGALVPARAPDPTLVPGAGSDSRALTETPSTQPTDSRAPERDER